MRPPTLWISITCRLVFRNYYDLGWLLIAFYCLEISPGKSFFLPPIPAVSTYLSTNYLLGVTMMWLLTQDNYASYTVSVRQYRILQSRFLHCCRHQQPACDLLMLSRYIGTHKGLSPSVKIKSPKTVGCWINICIFGIYSHLRSWVHCSCRAHTSVWQYGGWSATMKPLCKVQQQ